MAVICCLCLFFQAVVPQILFAAETSGYYYPAEWEDHDSLWLGFRTSREGIEYEPVLRQMLVALTERVHVNLVVESLNTFLDKEEYLSSPDLKPQNIAIVPTHSEYFWLRDTGPIFLQNARGEIRILAAPFTRYRSLYDPQATLSIANHQKFIDSMAQRLGIAVLPADIVLEGGAFDVNGAGVVILSSTILDRNPRLSRVEIEKRILQLLGQKKAIWLGQGIAEDPYGFSRITGSYWGRGTGGHLDQFVRFVNKNTVLLAWVPDAEKESSPIAKINFQRMHKNFEILSESTDLEGRKFNIIKVPFPPLTTYNYTITKEFEPFYKKRHLDLEEGDEIIVVAAASYLNFVVTNNLILLPVYEQNRENEATSGRDECMLKVMKQLFPRHDIVQIDPLRLNWHGGGMHCLLQQQPAPFP
ncbi:MAG: agmatine deiminase family protein [Desulfuromusa sp.]|nr:agmatine deiminase family protein [Desulfuromusa sp.]